MKILIVDDNRKFTNTLQEDIRKFFQKNQDKAIITVINNDFENMKFIDEYHIVFLDIHLLNENGLNIAKQLREVNHNVIIVFVSSNNNLVFKTFDVKPFFFIRKSHYKQDIDYFFNMLKTYFKTNTYIYLDSRSSMVHIPIDSILYIESHEHQLWVYSKKDIYYDNSTLTHFLSKLSYPNFAQIHKSYIINLDYLKRIDKNEILLLNHTRLPIGRKYKQTFLDKYQEYLIK